MNLQNAVNFIDRPRVVSDRMGDVALRRAVRGTGASSYVDAAAAATAAPAAGTSPSSGGITTAQGLQFGAQLTGALANLATGIYSAQLQKQQAERDAKLQAQYLSVQKNQQQLDAYKLLSSQQGRDVAVGGAAPGAGGDALSGGAMIAALAAVAALFMLR